MPYGRSVQDNIRIVWLVFRVMVLHIINNMSVQIFFILRRKEVQLQIESTQRMQQWEN